MKKILMIAVITLFAASCQAGYLPPTGLIYTGVTLNKDVATATDVGAKSGKACARSYLGMVAIGDASIKAAAAKGKIKTIKSVDYKYTNVLGSVYVKVCTIANGD